MNIRKATASYEAWIQNHIPLVKDDLDLKHQLMARDPFLFLRGTYYRWAQTFPALCLEANSAPTILAVGDLHIENFGTWRDAEGRLVWGVNDFDEAARLPYTHDLVRLLASAELAAEADDHFGLGKGAASEAVLSGYRAGLSENGEPFVLEEEHGDLRALASGVLRDPVRFWQKMNALPDLDKSLIPPAALAALIASFPPGTMPTSYKRRVAGTGSLGRPRLVAVTRFDGGGIAREAKPLAPSAVVWAGGADVPPLYQTIIAGAVRARDPLLAFHDGGWMTRRLAPFCTRIELARLTEAKSETDLLYAMGYETANIHQGGLSGEQLAALRSDLEARTRRDAGWLRAASETMRQSVRADWEEWRRGA